MRSQTTVSSVTTVFPPQAKQRRCRQAASGRAEGESAGRKRMDRKAATDWSAPCRQVERTGGT
jgi:hypothetical protein